MINNNTLFIKIFLSFMFITGILQLDIIGLQWEYITIIRPIHIIGSIILCVQFIIPFVLKHSYYYLIDQKISSKDGLVFGFILLLEILSGAYLFFIGNTGGDTLGIVSFYIHLFGSFLLLVMLFYHVSKAKKLKNFINTIILLALFTFPTFSYSESKLTLMQYDDKVNRYHSEDWTNSAKCKSCHEDIFNQWADSNHKHIAGANPYYMVLEALAQEDMGVEFRQWCMGCHNPSAVSTNLKKTSHAMDGNFLSNEMFEKGAKTLLDTYKEHGNFVLEEGVSCVACHRITQATSQGNASFFLNLTQRKKYAFEDSDSQLAQVLSEKFINSKPDVHKQSYSKDLYKESKYCASCHNEFLPSTGKKVVSTYEEWENSPFNNPNDPTKHKTCIDCHMTNLKDGKFSPLKGTSTKGGTLKNDIKVHYFSGSNHFLSGLKNKVHEQQTLQLLRTSAQLSVDLQNNTLYVGVKNVGAGHHLPTGTSDFRELWLEVDIKDTEGRTLFESGKLQQNGDLKDEARVFMKVFGDKDSKPVGLLFWRYEKLLKDTRIPAGETRIEEYKLTQINSPIKVTVKLNFRIYPQWVTNAVRKVYPQLPNPPVVELNKIVKEFDL